MLVAKRALQGTYRHGRGFSASRDSRQQGGLTDIGEPPLLNWLDTTTHGQPLLANFMATALDPVRQACEHGDLEAGVRVFILVGSCPSLRITGWVRNASSKRSPPN